VPDIPVKPKKKKRPATPSARTKLELETRGWIVDKCEQRLPIPVKDKFGKPNPFANITRDLFNMFDFIGIAPLVNVMHSVEDGAAGRAKALCISLGRSSGNVVVGIQVTSHQNHADRRRKITDNAIHLAWKNAGALIVLHSWGKTGKRGEVKTVTLREEWL
jgi:hypothetical protein